MAVGIIIASRPIRVGAFTAHAQAGADLSTYRNLI